MFPALAKRFAGASNTFAVYPDRNRHERAAPARMAYDSASANDANDRLSISRIFPDIAKRLKLG